MVRPEHRASARACKGDVLPSGAMRLRALLGLSTLLVATAAAACGGGKPPAPPTPGGAAADAGAGVTAAKTQPAASLGPLPPLATMPPPGVSGSKKAKRRSDPALETCAGAMPRAKDPEALVKKVGEACAKTGAAVKLKPVGALLRGQGTDAAPHAEHKVRVEAGKCYRMYFATDEGARDVVVVARDSAGDIVAESPGPALPSDGAMCFTSADEVTLLVAVGSGKASYVVQTWGD